MRVILENMHVILENVHVFLENMRVSDIKDGQVIINYHVIN